MTKRALMIAAALLLAHVSGAAPGISMEYTPVPCIKAGELPLLQLRIEGQGELRSYFRRINSTDWCSVEGTNGRRGPPVRRSRRGAPSPRGHAAPTLRTASLAQCFHECSARRSSLRDVLGGRELGSAHRSRTSSGSEPP